jgi:PhoPQ-activated pathogenicity-related protein
MPNLTWKHETLNGRLRLTVEATPAPTGARLWVAQAPTQDFRRAKWREQAVTFSKGIVIGEVSPPEKGYLAFYGDLDYKIDGLKYHLSTQVRMTEGK